MPLIDLTRYIVASDGPWTDPSQEENLFGFTVADTMSAERLMLRWAGDFVALTGPLSIRVTVQAENMTVPLALVGNLSAQGGVYTRSAAAPKVGVEMLQRPAAAALSEAALGRFGNIAARGLQASTIYDYTLDIAAGQAWPFSLSEHLEAYRLQNARGSRFEQLGNNLGYRVIIEPAIARAKATPVGLGRDLPCDFAVADQPNSADFFPSACEPCNVSVVCLPHGCATSLATLPAEGGCVRTHFFDGMFITREDLETEQRYHRMKSRLHNRAAGEGVVWGLAVGKHGTRVCVLPGYGVDCCGNDLTLTTVYEVEIASLLADPALCEVACQRGPQHASLLLEFVECPSHPRPVHGDVCAPDASRCEMSRIRESVRLRLVPPRDPAQCVDSFPIGQFLAEVKELRRRYPLELVQGAAGVDRAPFQLRISARGLKTPLLVRPSSAFDPAAFDTLRGKAPAEITIELVPDAMWAFIDGEVGATATAGAKAVNGVVGPASPTLGGAAAADATVTFTLKRGNLPDQLVYELKGWQAQTLFASQEDPAPLGSLMLTMRLRENTLAEIDLRQTPIESRAPALAESPCDGGACKPQRSRPSAQDCRGSYQNVFGRMLDEMAQEPASVLPWLHADPTHPEAAGDPKALLLGALGGWLAQALVRERAGAGGTVSGPRRQMAEAIHRAAWVLLFGVSGRAAPAELGATLRRLLEAWCDALLWKGPQCCGEPHGVVIGCAVIEGGTISHIDPFGGRRHVIHYPLLAHWGAQFGLAPLDITASAFFSKICCLGSLPAVGGRQMDPQAAWIPLGRAYLGVGEPRQVQARAEQALRDAAIATRRSVGLPEMIATAIAAAASTSSERPNDAQARYAALTLADFVADQTVVLFVPL
jgi:hypothetical protein